MKYQSNKLLSLFFIRYYKYSFQGRPEHLGVFRPTLNPMFFLSESGLDGYGVEKICFCISSHVNNEFYKMGTDVFGPL